ncbi:MAG: DUF2752 domain-containing protein [Isosphaeraceae bacterium]
MATSGQRLSRSARWALATLALALSALLATAAGLKPDPRGFGTHEQLGLPQCAFQAVTGVPCPSCGMTTAFAWSVRGRPDRAWRANPAGSLLAPLCGLLVLWLLAVVALGRPLGTRSVDRPLMIVTVAAVALSLGAWTFQWILWRVLG